MSKRQINKSFKYAGNKEFCIDTINDFIQNYCSNYKVYKELFVGSGSIFYNLLYNKPAIINDYDFSICYMHNAIKQYSYEEYINEYNKIIKTYGNIKENKESYYKFRDDFNKKYWNSILNKKYDEGGLWLLILASSCINSMLRFGPNGMNQSYGNRSRKIAEDIWNSMQNKLKFCEITNKNYEELLDENIIDTVLFLDPPYVNREMTYNNGFNQEIFLNKLKNITGTNSLILYTDSENTKSDELLNYGYNKYILRTMRNISPNRKTEFTVNECLYWKQF